VAIVMHCKLKVAPTSRHLFWAVVGQLCTSHAQKLLFISSSQNADVNIRLSNPINMEATVKVEKILEFLSVKALR